MRRLGQDRVMFTGGSRYFDESTGTYRPRTTPAAAAPVPLEVEPRGPSMTARSDAGLCFDATGQLVVAPRRKPGWWPPWYTGWSNYLAPVRERTPSMYTRSATRWLPTPKETAMARLGALGQDFFTSWDPALISTPPLDIPAVDVSGGFFSGIDWSTIGSASAEVLKAATPIAVPLLQQAIFGATTPKTRSAPPPGYTYAPSGQLMRLPPTMMPAPSTWSRPLLLVGAVVIVGGGAYFLTRRRRR